MRQVRKVDSEESDLDLAPMLSMIVALIPVLLLSFSFFQLGVVEAVLPQAGEKAGAEKRNWKIELNLKNANVIELQVKEAGRGIYRKVLPAQNKQYDLKGLRAEALSLKKRAPDQFKVELRIFGAVTYETVMKVMDEIRKAEGEWLFPDVVFADVFEG